MDINPSGSRVLGFRRYVCGEKPELDFVSRSLCSLLGTTRQQLKQEEDYIARILPEDREAYGRFLGGMGAGLHSASVSYGLRGPDGRVLKVRDTVTSYLNPDGSCELEAVLTPDRETKAPWGYVRCTCEKQPRITYMNKTMKELLRLPVSRQGEADYLEFFEENVFLMLPMEERRRFSRYLERICTEDVPVFGEIALLRIDIQDHLHRIVGNQCHGQGLLNFVLAEKPQRHKGAVGIENDAENHIVHEQNVEQQGHSNQNADKDPQILFGHPPGGQGAVRKQPAVQLIILEVVSNAQPAEEAEHCKGADHLLDPDLKPGHAAVQQDHKINFRKNQSP